MTTIHTVTSSPLPAARVLEAAFDFSDRRAQVFPAVSLDYLEVHELGDSWADVTEGTRAGIGINWERCRYDWSQPGSVTATVTDSNVYAVRQQLGAARDAERQRQLCRDDLGAQIPPRATGCDIRNTLPADRQTDLPSLRTRHPRKPP